MMSNNTPIPERFVELGNMFLQVHKSHNATSDNLDFSTTYVRTNECGTVACHGGWGIVLFRQDLTEGFELGADHIAYFLGFNYWENLVEWADLNPSQWLNEYGGDMFTSDGHMAFGFGCDDIGLCTLEDIGKHYIAVGEQLMGVS